MNYSRNVMYRKNRKQAVFKRILISWVIILLVGAMIGFFIGRSTKHAITLPVTSETNEISISSFIPTVTPHVTQTTIQETSESQSTFELVSLGEFRITAYCPCEICCGNWAKNRPGGIVVGAAGTELHEGVSIASPLPFGTRVYIDGIGEYVVQDRTASWVAEKYNNELFDIYFDNHDAASAFGLQHLNVYITESEDENHD